MGGNRHDVNDFAVQTRWVQGLRNCKMESRWFWKGIIGFTNERKQFHTVYTSEMLPPTKVVLKFSYSACFLRVIMKKQFCVLKLFGTGQVVLQCFPFKRLLSRSFAGAFVKWAKEAEYTFRIVTERLEARVVTRACNRFPAMILGRVWAVADCTLTNTKSVMQQKESFTWISLCAALIWYLSPYRLQYII